MFCVNQTLQAYNAGHFTHSVSFYELKSLDLPNCYAYILFTVTENIIHMSFRGKFQQLCLKILLRQL